MSLRYYDDMKAIVTVILFIAAIMLATHFRVRDVKVSDEPLSREEERVTAVPLGTSTPEQISPNPHSFSTPKAALAIPRVFEIPQETVNPALDRRARALQQENSRSSITTLQDHKAFKGSVSSTTTVIPLVAVVASSSSVVPKIILPPLDVAGIMRAVVKIECPAKNTSGKYIGSGFLLAAGRVITAAHVIKDSASDVCTVIFPKERRPIYYLKGTIENLTEVKRRHDEDGVDAALIRLPDIDAYPEAKAIFEVYPSVPYSTCQDPVMLGDALLHFGYPSDYLDQNYLSELTGKAVVFADIKGIKEQLSLDQTYTFKSPVFAFTDDEFTMHPYIVSRVASFYGDSGGLAFNATKQCILGPHRGGTIGGSEGENYSIFINLGWPGAKIYPAL